MSKQGVLSQDECLRRNGFTEPKLDTLKDILEELHKLKDSDFKRTVFGHLKDGLRTYCAQTYLNAFYSDEGDHNYGGYIQAFTFDARNICLAIVERSSWDGHSNYTHGEHPECVQKYAEAIKKCLPGLFVALFFLLFNCDSGCRTIHGGKWNNVKVNQNHEKLGKWLTQDDSLTDLITRGYKLGELNQSKTGQKVANELKKVVSLQPGRDAGSLQKVLCGLMFVCTWNPALTGHALLFLYHFCDKVTEYQVSNNLQGKLKKHSKVNADTFYSVCFDLQAKLLPFVDKSDFCLTAVCHENSNLYSQLWDDEHFEDYVKWLEKKLTDIIGSLKKFSSNSSPWSAGTLEHFHTAVPFQYGFVFTDSWDGNWESVRGEIERYISPLTDESKGSLDELRKCLNGELLSYAYQSSHHSQTQPEGNSSNSGAAAGASVGVLSLGGAGFGAAYGFNLFGLKDIMSGVFGAIRGLVVGF
ncbi:hypothetical protein X943_000037 [Babesia divergens]|uniref:Uncharacterized protein n=1 Tax=Babesia divergens TaxID=32595 RepID=A0AAD9GGX1_BABDI|nr:hypothetical protein X943_000037 [Babesia divergens]